MSPAMKEMAHYPRYLLGQVERVLGQRVLEIGVGHGQYTQELRRQGRAVRATDIDEDCLRHAASRFVGDDQVQFGKIDLRDPTSIAAQQSFQADSILCFNVLEHIEDDESALAWLREVVQNHAVLALIVPAHPTLFGKMDREAGHYRRYTSGSLSQVLSNSGWQIQRIRYINIVGAAGWWYHNRLRRDAGLADESVNQQMRMVDRVLPIVSQVTDPLFGRVAGLSLVAWGRKRGEA